MKTFAHVLNLVRIAFDQPAAKRDELLVALGNDIRTLTQPEQSYLAGYIDARRGEQDRKGA